MAGLNLDKVKAEINFRKQERGEENVGLVERGASIMPKDNFLHKLIEAHDNGRPNVATNLIKTVDSRAETIKPSGNPLTPDLSKHLPPLMEENTAATVVNKPLPNPIAQQPVYIPPVGVVKENEERELGLYAEIEKRNNEYRRLNSNYPTTNYLANNNVGQAQQPKSINEESIIDNVEKRVLSNLNDSFASGIKDILKSTIVELYTVDKIKTVLSENPEMMKNILIENKPILKQIVIEIIKELQKK